jgi:hypothetical protein
MERPIPATVTGDGKMDQKECPEGNAVGGDCRFAAHLQIGPSAAKAVWLEKNLFQAWKNVWRCSQSTIFMLKEIRQGDKRAEAASPRIILDLA